MAIYSSSDTYQSFTGLNFSPLQLFYYVKSDAHSSDIDDLYQGKAINFVGPEKLFIYKWTHASL